MYSANNHYLQSEQWALARHGSVWEDQTLMWQQQPLRTYVRNSPIGSIVFIPGFHPLSDDIAEFTQFIKDNYPASVLCKLETCCPYSEELEASLKANGWQCGRTTQYSHTVQFDLTKTPQALLVEMKKRARNEMNRAINNSVTVHELEPTDSALKEMYQLLTSTANRKQFTVHDESFIFTYWGAMREAGMLRLFQATKDKQVLAAAVVLVSKDGQRAWYKEGASTLLEPQLNAPRLLLWEIAQILQKDGIQVFDLGGIPDPDTHEQSRMKGIFTFKTAYSNDITTMMPVYELPLKPTRYKLWPKTELVLKKLAYKKGENWY